MSILDIDMKSKKKQIRKTIWIYLILSVIAVASDKVYIIFGHGIDSPSMTWMFLYPLLGGGLFYFIIERFIPYILKLSGYRVFCNIYNSGIATLTFGSLLKGIFVIGVAKRAKLQNVPVSVIAGGAEKGIDSKRIIT